MKTVLTEVIAKAESQGRFISVADTQVASNYYRGLPTRLHAAKILARESTRLVEGATNAVFMKFPYLTMMQGSNYASTPIGKAKCFRDINHYLRYIHYSLVIGSTSYMDENLISGLNEVFLTFGLSPAWSVWALRYIKSNHGLIGEAATETNIYIDHLINALGGLRESEVSARIEARIPEQPVRPGFPMKRYYYIRGHRREVEQIEGVLALQVAPDSRAGITSKLGTEQLQVSGAELEVFENAGWTFVEESSASQRGSGVPEGVRTSGAVFRRPEDGTIIISTNALTIKLQPNLSEENAANKLQRERLSIKRRLKFSPNLFEVSVPTEVDPLDLANRLQEDEDVIFAEPVMIEHIQQRFTPTDPEYGRQWQWKNDGINGYSTNADIKAEVAWDHANGKNVRVAVIDNAFDVNHEDLKAGIVAESGYFLQQDESLVQGLTGYPNDAGYPNNGHGTFCAGMVGARGNNDCGGCGIAFECELLLIACLRDQVGTQNTLARAIAYAVDPSTEIDGANPSTGADIISCSLGPSRTGRWDMGVALEAAIDFAASQGRNGLGTPIFWATSNASVLLSDDQVCSHTQVIAVGRANSNDMADGSAYGTELDFLAPGVDVYSTLPGNNYGIKTGASFATPCVAGVAALLLNLSSNLTNAQLRQILRDTCDKVGGVNYNDGHHNHYGFGRINATKAVKAILPPGRVNSLSVLSVPMFVMFLTIFTIG